MVDIGRETLGRLYKLDPEPRVFYTQPPEGFVAVGVVAAEDKVVRASVADDDHAIVKSPGSRVLYFCVPRVDATRLGLT